MKINNNVEIWLDISRLLFKGIIPRDSGPEILGVGMNAEDFAELVDRESANVDKVLIAMALSKGEAEVKAIALELPKDTLIALFSRWAHYYKQWEGFLHNPDPPLWMPPGHKDLWRAVFLAMTSENVHSSEAIRSLWPELFSERL